MSFDCFLSEVDEIRTNAAISLLEIQYGYKIVSICYDRVYVHMYHLSSYHRPKAIQTQNILTLKCCRRSLYLKSHFVEVFAQLHEANTPGVGHSLGTDGSKSLMRANAWHSKYRMLHQ